MNIQQENDARRREIIEELAAKSKAPNDSYWKRAVALGAQPDYSESDHGTHWSDLAV